MWWERPSATGLCPTFKVDDRFGSSKWLGMVRDNLEHTLKYMTLRSISRKLFGGVQVLVTDSQDTYTPTICKYDIIQHSICLLMRIIVVCRIARLAYSPTAAN